MAREDPQFKLRMPEELHARIAQAAERSGRSMNTEIVRRLEESLELDSYADRPMFARAASNEPAAAYATDAQRLSDMDKLGTLAEFAAAVERFNALSVMRSRTRAQDDALERITARWGDPPSWERGR